MEWSKGGTINDHSSGGGGGGGGGKEANLIEMGSLREMSGVT